MRAPVNNILPADILPRVYILPPVTTPVAVTLAEDILSVAVTLPTLRSPKVYILDPLTLPVAVTLPDDIIS